jgi:alpha-L-rhamnosidase
LPSVTATYPHPQGDIQVEFHRQGAGLAGSVTLPGSLTGIFVFHGKTTPLHAGMNQIQAP